MRYEYDDGGRAAAGFRGLAGDCAVRAVAIATGLPYREVYDGLNATAKTQRGRGRTSNARTGVWPSTVKLYMAGLGWVWVPTMGVGTGCRVHLRADELPSGPLVVRLTRHYAAVVDGTLRDNHDCSRGGTRCVYGYFRPADAG